MYLCKIDYVTAKYTRASMLNYNEVMRLLELVGVAEQAQST